MLDKNFDDFATANLPAVKGANCSARQQWPLY